LEQNRASSRAGVKLFLHKLQVFPARFLARAARALAACAFGLHASQQTTIWWDGLPHTS
jgi:hypothetical protein